MTHFNSFTCPVSNITCMAIGRVDFSCSMYVGLDLNFDLYEESLLIVRNTINRDRSNYTAIITYSFSWLLFEFSILLCSNIFPILDYDFFRYFLLYWTMFKSSLIQIKWYDIIDKWTACYYAFIFLWNPYWWMGLNWMSFGSLLLFSWRGFEVKTHWHII